MPRFGSGSNSYKRSFGLNDSKLDDLLNRGRHESDQARRIQIYTDLQRASAEVVPVVPLSFRGQGWGIRNGVKGFRALPNQMLNQIGMALDSAYIG